MVSYHREKSENLLQKKNILVLYLHKRNIFLSIYNIVPPTIVQYNWSSTHVY